MMVTFGSCRIHFYKKIKENSREPSNLEETIEFELSYSML